MKAIAQDHFGGPEVLRKRGLPRPDPVDDEVRVRVVVAGVSTLDAAVREGFVEPDSIAFPWVPGFEVAGVVDAMGPACVRVRQGDRVCALLPRGGGCAEYAVVAERNVVAMPASILFEEAASMVLDGTAVWRALLDGPSLGGAVVLGASSGAGHLAVQLALAAGARVVARTSAAQRDFVDRLGRVEWAQADATAADLIGGLGESARLLDCSEPAYGPTRPAEGLDLRGGPGSAQDTARREDPARALSALSALVEKRRLRPRLHRILDIGKAADAHRMLDAGDMCGKLALSF